MNNDFSQIITEISKSKNIMLVCHKSPDGDAFGSTTALYKALINLNKNVEIYCEFPYNEKLDFIPNSNAFSFEKKIDKYDLAISLDCSDLQRIYPYINLFQSAKTTICIDHHSTNTGFADINYISGDSAANCEFLYTILKEIEKSLGKCLDDEIATSLYCGIITDSGHFMNNNTTALTKKIAQEIDENFNIDTVKIIKHFMDEVSYDVFKLKTRVLAKAIFNEEKTVGVICFTKKDFSETNTDQTCTEGIINSIINIIGVRVAAAITEIGEESFKVSLRSKPEYPINILAKNKGGGGHQNAAGYNENGYFYDVVDRVMRDCSNYAE